MDGVQAINELNELNKRLSAQIKQLGKYGIEWAEAEHKYNLALARQTLILKDEGNPATLIDKLVKGKVANEKLKLSTAEVMYKTALEQVNGTKLQIRVLDNQIAREWANG